MSGFSFEPANTVNAIARIGISGPAGSGKTFGALLLARGLVGDVGRIAVIDTERGRSRHYAKMFKFDVLALTAPYTPARYTAALSAAWAARYDVVIVDSLSHEWAGVGGVLEMVDQRKGRGSDFAAWKEPSADHTRLIDTIVSSPSHIICCVRSKVHYEVVNEGGKAKPKKLGLAPIQREGIDFEFDLMLSVDPQTHYATIEKCNTAWSEAIHDALLTEPRVSGELGRKIRAWLSDSLTAAPQAPTPMEPPPPPPPHKCVFTEEPFCDICSAPAPDRPPTVAEVKKEAGAAVAKVVDAQVLISERTKNHLFAKARTASPPFTGMNALASWAGNQLGKPANVHVAIDGLTETEAQRVIVALEKIQPQATGA